MQVADRIFARVAAPRSAEGGGEGSGQREAEAAAAAAAAEDEQEEEEAGSKGAGRGQGEGGRSGSGLRGGGQPGSGQRGSVCGSVSGGQGSACNGAAGSRTSVCGSVAASSGTVGSAGVMVVYGGWRRVFAGFWGRSIIVDANAGRGIPTTARNRTCRPLVQDQVPSKSGAALVVDWIGTMLTVV